ncbi:unnamed protein product [Amaranthus hypochondriacus]
MATISPDDGDVVHASRPQKKLKSIPCLDHPGDDYLDRDLVDEEELEEPYDVLKDRRKVFLADLNFYQGLAEKVLTYYNSKEGENLLLKEVLIADREHTPETEVCMNFIARAEDDSKLFYFFARLKDGPFPKYRDIKEMLLKESFKEPEISDFHVKYYCMLETHDSDYLQSRASRSWGSYLVYPQGYWN